MSHCGSSFSRSCKDLLNKKAVGHLSSTGGDSRHWFLRVIVNNATAQGLLPPCKTAQLCDSSGFRICVLNGPWGGWGEPEASSSWRGWRQIQAEIKREVYWGEGFQVLLFSVSLDRCSWASVVPVGKLATGPIRDSLDAVLMGFVKLGLLTTGSVFLLQSSASYNFTQGNLSQKTTMPKLSGWHRMGKPEQNQVIISSRGFSS